MPRKRTINYDAPVHRCPVCHHTCTLRRGGSTGNPLGRPPREMRRLVQLLQKHTNDHTFLTISDIADKLDINKISTPQYLYRARKRGLDIRCEPRKGYWMPQEQDKDALDRLSG